MLRAPRSLGEGGSLSKGVLVCAVENLRKPFIRFPLGFLSAHAELVEACFLVCSCCVLSVALFL